MLSSLKATLGYGDRADPGSALSSLTATLPFGQGSTVEPPPTAAVATSHTTLAELAETAALSETVAAPSIGGSLATSLGAARRTTVLPRRKRGAAADAGPEWHVDTRPRYEKVKLLGRGGMGEVALVQDHDINRTVAVKRLLPGARADEAVLRFADEVRAVGQLEHPGIVPVYDVGIDEEGQHYLVMKNVEGETLESVIDHLKAGDPAYLERFPYEHRTRIFLEIVQAIGYAHQRGIIHRDIKPANVMVGPFGEVTVMDWGLAKKVDRSASAPGSPSDAGGPPLAASADGRLLETVHGALLGTPLYMSPEQAAGRNDDLDERSDVFSLCMMFYELLVLSHPLEHATNIHEVLAALTARDLPLKDLAGRGLKSGAPAELMFLVTKGLERDREKRFRSVAEMEDELRAILSGRIKIQCHVTLAKRAGHAFLHWVDRHALAYSLLFLGTVLGVVGGIVTLGVLLVRAL